MMYEYIEKNIESATGCDATCWRVQKVEIYPGQNVNIQLVIYGWKDIDAYLAGKVHMATRTVNFEHAEEMPSYPAVFTDFLTKMLSDLEFAGGTYKTKEV